MIDSTQTCNGNAKRVLLAVEPRLFRDALRRQLQETEGVEVVGEATTPVELLVQVGSTQADVVIHSWTKPSATPPIYSLLFQEYPELMVIGIEPGQGRAYKCRQIVLCSPLETATVNQMISAIRRPAAMAG